MSDQNRNLEKMVFELKRELDEVKSNQMSSRLSRFFRKCFGKTNVLVGVGISFLLTSMVIYAYGVGTRTAFQDGFPIVAQDVNDQLDEVYNHINTGAFVELTSAFTGTCVTTGSDCSSIVPVVFNSVVYNDTNFDGTTTYRIPTGGEGIYEVLMSMPTFTNIDCSGTPMFYAKIYHNGIPVDLSTILNLGLNDTVTVEVDASTSSGAQTSDCTFEVNAGLNLLIRKLF